MQSESTQAMKRRMLHTILGSDGFDFLCQSVLQLLQAVHALSPATAFVTNAHWLPRIPLYKTSLQDVHSLSSDYTAFT